MAKNLPLFDGRDVIMENKALTHLEEFFFKSTNHRKVVWAGGWEMNGLCYMLLMVEVADCMDY